MLNKIKASQLQARKDRDEVKKDSLSTILGEFQNVQLRENRQLTEDEVLKIVRKFETSARENIEFCTGKTDRVKLLDIATRELEILQEFLPQKITNNQIQKDIGTVMTNLNLPKEQKSMGPIGKALKEKYGDSYEGKQVAEVFKELMKS